MVLAIKCDNPNCTNLVSIRKGHYNRKQTNGNKTFCCKDCQYADQKTGLEFDCAGGCGKKVYRTAGVVRYSKTQRFFCGHTCSASVTNLNRVYTDNTKNRLKESFCLYCNKSLNLEFYVKRYCDNICMTNHRYSIYIESWKRGFETGNCGTGLNDYIRRYIKEKYENKCAECGWAKVNPFTKLIPLTIEHINGHWYDNREENLVLLCPNCHSLTSTYGSLNKGNGRPNRKN